MLDLEPIKARLAVATPGPWHVEPEATACGSFVARMPGIYIEPEHQHLAPAGNDAALIANAPADIAALVAEVERLTKDNERLMAKLDAACEMGQDSIKRGAEARAENKRLREALEPFAALLDPEEDWGAITIVDIGVRIEDVRAARVALEMEGER